ncbi:unnamed protein product [Adineta ricciae]|uniref:Tetraspanin n=1 Tax=Adineta ricciae TaxID=249248 RepID=A0A814IRC0_ADIRI|nr:unnamed protein product [Adineta ricciae]
MACCLCAKYFLLFFNLIIWLSGGAFLSCGILVLYRRDLHELFALLSYDSDYVPSFLNVGYVLIGIGALVFIVGLLGCCGSVRESRLLLGLYVFFIILVMGGELVVALYTVLLGVEWDTKLERTLQRRLLTYNYSMPQRFEYDLDVVQKQFACCGIHGAVDYYENMDYKISGNRLPSSCCNDLFNGACIEAHSYRIGCFTTINDSVQYYARLIVAVGIGIALLELTALMMAVCVCRNTKYDDEFD